MPRPRKRQGDLGTPHTMAFASPKPVGSLTKRTKQKSELSPLPFLDALSPIGTPGHRAGDALSFLPFKMTPNSALDGQGTPSSFMEGDPRYAFMDDQLGPPLDMTLPGSGLKRKSAVSVTKARPKRKTAGKKKRGGNKPKRVKQDPSLIDSITLPIKKNKARRQSKAGAQRKQSGALSASSKAMDAKARSVATLAATGPQIRRGKPCHCRKSHCLKLYCECFSNAQYCIGCKCNDCENSPYHLENRYAAIRAILDRSPNAFRPKVDATKGGGAGISTRHSKGCNCRKSACKKKYCECFQHGIFCGAKCACVGCENQIDLDTLSPGKRARLMVVPKPPQPSLLGYRAGKCDVEQHHANSIFSFLSDGELLRSVGVSKRWGSWAMDEAVWAQPGQVMTSTATTTAMALHRHQEQLRLLEQHPSIGLSAGTTASGPGAGKRRKRKR